MVQKNKKAIQVIVKRFMKKYSIKPPPDLLHVAKVLKADILHVVMPEKVNGTTIPLKDGRFVILVNIIHPENRNRFTIAHEIGHIVLRHYKKGVSLSSSTNRYNFWRYPMEREADIFAAELLMPPQHVKHLAFDCGWRDINMFCKFYGVSRPAMEITLKEIGFVEADQ